MSEDTAKFLLTGLSFYNPNPSSNRVAIEVYHPDGNQLATASHEFGNWDRVSGLLSELVPDLGTLDGGSVVIRGLDTLIVQEATFQSRNTSPTIWRRPGIRLKSRFALGSIRVT